MAVGFTVNFYWDQVGTADFLYAFFSTVAYNLEKGEWGSVFPTIMNELYEGEILNSNLTTAIEELNTIRNELEKLTVDKVVWDIDDISKQPPWGNNISSEITDLSNYFVTSDGEDLITVLRCALNKAVELKTNIKISTL